MEAKYLILIFLKAFVWIIMIMVPNVTVQKYTGLKQFKKKIKLQLHWL